MDQLEEALKHQIDVLKVRLLAAQMRDDLEKTNLTSIAITYYEKRLALHLLEKEMQVP